VTAPSPDTAHVELEPDGTVRALDGAAEHLYGLSPAECQGRPLAALLLGERAGEQVELPWAERLQSLSPAGWSAIEVHRSTTGVRLWAAVSLAWVDGRARLSARRATGLEVVSPGDLIRFVGQALDVGGIGCWLDDGPTDRLTWSSELKRLYDLGGVEPVTHAQFFEKIHPDDRARVAEEVQRTMAQRIPFRSVLRTEDGQGGYRTLDVFGGPFFDPGGELLFGLGGARDITAEVRLRERVGELESQLRQAQKLDVVGRLAGGIAHDFNNLLTGILGADELLLLSDLGADQRVEVEAIREAAERAAELTRQLLAFGRRQALFPHPVPLDTLVLDSYRLLRRIVDETIALELGLEAGDRQVLVDVSQFHQVLVNLVVNAAQAMPDGGAVTIRTASPTPETLTLSVEDQGAGIPAEVLPHVFEPFYTTKPAGQGTGLGLSVVQGIVEQHGGQMSVTSTQGQGSTFTVTFPLSEAPLEAGGVAPAAKPGAFAEGLRVLLVEDEPMVRVMTRRILEGAGLEVLEATDGVEALERISPTTRLDMVLTDVLMPRMTGPALVETLRQDRPGLRALYVSGYPAGLISSRVSLGPIDELLDKPFTRTSLLAKIHELLARC
jgi:signal transduction histidine kinase